MSDPSRPPFGYRLIAALVRAGFRLARWRIDVEGFEHVPRSGGVVLTWNHTGHMDFAVTALPLLDRTGRWARLLALRELWQSPLLGWAPRIGHAVPVERSSAAGRVDALDAAVDALQDGHLVMVAPEGTISTTFDLQPFRTGAVRMARDAQVPVVPTASWGSHRFATTGHPPSLLRGWRLPVVVRVGEPLLVAPGEDLEAATERLRRRTSALLEEARSAYPDGAPSDAWWVPPSMGGASDRT